MYLSKDTDSVPTFKSPWIRQGWTPATNTPVFPSHSFILQSSAWFNIFSPHWSGTPVRSQLVFCMHFCV